MPVSGLALQPEELAIDEGHEVGFELAAILQHALDVGEQLEIAFGHRGPKALVQDREDVDLEPAAREELPDLAVLGGDDAQLLLGGSVVVEVLEHAVAMQQGAELHRSRARGLAVAVDIDPLATTGGDTALDLLVELGKQVEVGAEVTRKMLEGLVAVQVILPFVDHDLAGLQVVHHDAGGRVIGDFPRQGTPRRLVPTRPPIAITAVTTVATITAVSTVAAATSATTASAAAPSAAWRSLIPRHDRATPIPECFSKECDFFF